MNKAEFLKQIRATADVLKPLTEHRCPGDRVYNGVEYALYTGEPKVPDPYALAWWSMMITIDAVISAQESPLSKGQIEHLERLLCGGMGSLTDLWFDPKKLGDIAKKVNDRLDRQRRVLYESFKND